MWYASKYIAKNDAEFLADVPYGRSWGVFNRQLIPWAKIVEIDFSSDPDMACRVRRLMRRYLEHKRGRRVGAGYGCTVYGDVRQFLRGAESTCGPPDPF
jgi:hypothetical protein